MILNISDLICSDDPLSDRCVKALIEHCREDFHVDYKLDLRIDEKKAVLDLTKDIAAFANSYGGYLVIGVKDGTFEQIGIDEEQARRLADANNIHQKINPFLDPEISNVLTRDALINGKHFVLIFVPQSIGKTHVISRNGTYRNRRNKEQVGLSRGTIYVRRSGFNQLATSRDIDEIVENRLLQYRERILEQISRVVQAPFDSEVLVVEEDKSGQYQSIVIRDGPESIPVKGVSFSRSPKSTEESIQSHIALYKHDGTLPPLHTLLNWYCKRHEIQISNEEKIYVVQFMLFAELGPFVWMQDLSGSERLDALKKVALKADNIFVASIVAKVAQFLGRKGHQEVVRKLGARADRIEKRYRIFPEGSVLENVLSMNWQYRMKSEAFVKERLEEELNKIVCVSDSTGVTKRLSRPDYWRAFDLDCVLYSQ